MHTSNAESARVLIGIVMRTLSSISIPTASELVTVGVEIGSGFGSVEEFAAGLETISITSSRRLMK